MKQDNKHLFSLSNQMKRFPIKIRVLNNFGNFDQLDKKSLSRILGSDDFSISKGANSDDMARMSPSGSRFAAAADIAVGTVDMFKLVNIVNVIKKKVITNPEYGKIKFAWPALFIAVIQRNKEDSNIARLDDVQFIERNIQEKIKAKAKRLKKNHEMCLDGKTSCLTKASKVNKSVYYENLFLVVGKE